MYDYIYENTYRINKNEKEKHQNVNSSLKW